MSQTARWYVHFMRNQEADKKRSACDREEDGMSLNDEEEHFNLVSLLLTKPKVLKLQSVLTIHGLEVEGESKCNLPVIMTYTCKS